eukprot:gnl/MRDRNA2_/MRDRNA2_68940_c0_seq1.p1 gnl/MRDRNA2_/MRDRNA2_68940_c0~~gnl/MRDRNA2_/MRDRNA2_68940_c0_seq1.p1  ORF type:complete len:502 (+),score=41.91 gnl/MRDRNA2_/MRDRNA2_68940_c0_seq1:88-1593(+)
MVVRLMQRCTAFILFAWLSVQQVFMYCTYGMVPKTSEDYYGVKSASIDLFMAWGPVGFILALPMMLKSMSRLGGVASAARWGSTLCLSAGLVRLIPIVFVVDAQGTLSLACAHAGQFLNAMAGPFANASCTEVARAHFPIRWRGLIVGSLYMFQNVGSMFAFLTTPRIAEARGIPGILHFQFLSSVVPFFLAFAVLRSSYESPPESGAISLGKSVRACASNCRLMRLTAVAGAISGVSTAMTSLLPQMLSHRGFNQVQAGWCCFFQSCGMTAGNFVGGLLASTAFFGRLRTLVVMSLLLGALLQFLVTLSLPNIWMTGHYLVTQSGIPVIVASQGFALSMVEPVNYEVGEDLSHPHPPSVSSALLQLVFNVACLVVLVVAPFLGAKSANAALLFTVLLAPWFYPRSPNLEERTAHGHLESSRESSAVLSRTSSIVSSRKCSQAHVSFMFTGLSETGLSVVSGPSAGDNSFNTSAAHLANFQSSASQNSISDSASASESSVH